jgi:hypothetical protein
LRIGGLFGLLVGVNLGLLRPHLVHARGNHCLEPGGLLLAGLAQLLDGLVGVVGRCGQLVERLGACVGLRRIDAQHQIRGVRTHCHA